MDDPGDLMVSFVNVGTDIESVERFRGKENDPSFLRTFLSVDEISYCTGHDGSASRIAGHFAAKEAIIKAFSQFPGERPFFRDIEIGHRSDGSPYIVGRFGELPNIKISLSISHCEQYAIAVAAVYTLVRR